MTAIIISEKAKAAHAIAEGLGSIQSIKVNKFLTVYFVKNRDIYVIPLRGHIMKYENSPAFAKWEACDPREIIIQQNAIEKKPADYAGTYIKALKDYALQADLCIIGTDADIEGCNIGIMDALPFVQMVKPGIQVKQIWLNDLQKSSIQNAFQNLIPPKYEWAHSGEARAIIDAIIGFAATREVTLTLKPVLKAIDVRLASIGRVQSSLLYLLYLRELLIREFKPTPFWTITADILVTNHSIRGNHLKNNFTDKAIAQATFQRIQNEKEAIIQELKHSNKQIPVPTPLNTSKALMLITSILKINADHALATLEELYLNKIISYPRTDCDVYAEDFEHKKLIQNLSYNTNYSSYCQKVLRKPQIKPKQGHANTGDHSPITPLVSLESNAKEFSTDLQRKTYDLIARSYLALFGDPANEIDLNIAFSIKNEIFIANIKALLNSGFYEIAPFLSKDYEYPASFIDFLIKNHLENSKQPVKSIDLTEKQTQPPPRYNDTTLLKLMEQKNLGTKSTRPSIMKILIEREYIERKSRAIYVKELGYLLIDNLKEIWQPFLDPNFTAEVEIELKKVQDGLQTMNLAINQVRQRFLELFDKFRQQKANFLVKMGQVQQTGNISQTKKGTKKSQNVAQGPIKATTTSPCPKCKASMMNLVKLKDGRRFFACMNQECKTYLSIPKQGNPLLLKGTCQLCGFNILKISVKKGSSKYDYYICPVCWNQGLSEQNGKGFCSKCANFEIEQGKCIKKKNG